VGSTAPKNSAAGDRGSPPAAVTLSRVTISADGLGQRRTTLWRSRLRTSPRWASFDPATAASAAARPPQSVGIYANVQLTVSDGKASSALSPFSITVARGYTGPRLRQGR